MIALLIALPLLAGFISIVWKESSRVLLATVSILNLIFLLASKVGTVIAIGGWKPPFGIPLVLDMASFYAAFIVNIIFILISVLNFQIIEQSYGSVLLILLAALNGLLLTGDLFNSFVFLEIIAATGYILAYHKRNPYGAYKYLIIGGVAGAFYLLATIFSYGMVGSLNMAHVSKVLNASMVSAIGLLYIAGIGVEAKLFPLAGWVADVYASGSALTPTFLATAVSFSMLYLVGRIFITVLHGSYLNVLYILALITILFGELAALRQNKVLRALAYSSVAQAGIVISAISMNNLKALTAGYFHLLNDVTAKLILFFVAATLVNGFMKDKISGFAFTTASLSLIGFPIFAGFRSKLLLISVAFEKGDYLFPAVLLFASIVEAAYLIRWNIKLWHDSEAREELPWHSKIFVLILALLIIWIGIMPNMYLDVAEKISKALLNVNGYIDMVLGGM